MRVVFFGTASFAVPSLERVVAGRHEVAMCVTQPDRPQGRGLAPAPSPVKQSAQRLGLPLMQPERLSAPLFDAVGADVGVVAAYGQLIRPDLLALPRLGMLGVHPSLLPKYRGAAPVAWALLRGERTTGVTIFRLNEALDAGDIVMRQALPVEPGEDADALTLRLATLGAEQLARALDALAQGRAVFTPQDEAQASLAPKLTKSHGHIDWRQPAELIDRLVRAMVPWPGASTQWQGQPLKVWATRPVPGTEVPGTEVPGTVVKVEPEALVVMTGQGTLALRELQLPGRRRMRVKEFLAGHPVCLGERLGSDK